MTWYKDLEPCDYYGPKAATVLRAIGWLEGGKPYSTGKVDRRVYERLGQFKPHPLPLPVPSGVHACTVCQYEGDAHGYLELLIPGDGCLYICPSNLRHYMNAHGYRPPTVFCDAVLSCPDQDTMAYKRQLLKNGGSVVMKATKGFLG